MNLTRRLAVSTALAAVVGVSAAVAARNAAPLKVTSSLDGKSVLPIRTRWTAHPNLPPSKVAEVDYLIDGRLAWVEHHAPYFYGSDGNRLVTTFLEPGRHTFTVRLITTAGGRATDRVVARTLPSPAPPAPLGGTWARQVETGDQGRWTITISNIGWLFGDPHGGGQNQDVSYPGPARVLVRAAIEEPVFGKYDRGGAFCDHEPDPPGLYRYAVSSDGSTLMLSAVGHDCRAGLIQGTWSRVP